MPDTSWVDAEWSHRLDVARLAEWTLLNDGAETAIPLSEAAKTVDALAAALRAAKRYREHSYVAPGAPGDVGYDLDAALEPVKAWLTDTKSADDQTPPSTAHGRVV